MPIPYGSSIDPKSPHIAARMDPSARVSNSIGPMRSQGPALVSPLQQQRPRTAFGFHPMQSSMLQEPSRPLSETNYQLPRPSSSSSNASVHYRNVTGSNYGTFQRGPGELSGPAKHRPLQINGAMLPEPSKYPEWSIANSELSAGLGARPLSQQSNGGGPRADSLKQALSTPSRGPPKSPASIQRGLPKPVQFQGETMSHIFATPERPK